MLSSVHGASFYLQRIVIHRDTSLPPVRAVGKHKPNQVQSLCCEAVLRATVGYRESFCRDLVGLDIRTMKQLREAKNVPKMTVLCGFYGASQ